MIVALLLGFDWTLYRGNSEMTGSVAFEWHSPLTVVDARDLGFPVASTPVFMDGKLFIAGKDGTVICQQLSGEQIWKKNFELSFEAPLAMIDGLLYLGSIEGDFLALDPSNGSVIWKKSFDGEIHASPIPMDDLIVLGTYDYFMYGLNPKTGEEAWKFETDGYLHATVTRHQSSLLIGGCDGLLHWFNPKGESQHTEDLEGYVAATMSVSKGIGVVGNFQSKVLAFDLANKKKLWSFSDPGKDFPYFASPAISGDTVVVAGRDKLVRALDIHNGAELWQYLGRSKWDASPIVVGDYIFAASMAGEVVALNIDNGNKSFQFRLGQAVQASPIFTADAVCFIGNRGKLILLGQRKE